LQEGFLTDFEAADGGSPFGFTLEDRGGSYGLTEDVDIDDSTALWGDRSAYLSESWDRVSRNLDFEEGLVSVWFKDTGYDGFNSNGFRLRTEEEDPEKEEWPFDFVAVDYKGQKTGHGGGPIDYYYVVTPKEPELRDEGMGVYFGTDLHGATFERTENAWHYCSFLIEDGSIYTSLDNKMCNLVASFDPASLETMCRSPWYFTRPGDPKVMLWDKICMTPTLHSTVFDAVPAWMTANATASLVTSTSPSANMPFLPGTNVVGRLSGGNMSLSVPWEVDVGEVSLWFWDEMSDPGGNPDNGSIDIIVSNSSDSDEYFRLRTYETTMGQPTTKWYLVTPQSPTGMGNSLNIPRAMGWNRIVFHRTPGSLLVSANGALVTEESYRWDNPPRELIFEISSRKGYDDGNPVWLSRLTLTGTDLQEGPSAVSNWSLFK
jgi:hypothetical protein